MKPEPSHSPVLWAAIAIPVISATELFIDPATRESFGFFILGSFYLASVRYTLAVCLGVLAHGEALERMRSDKRGAFLWVCYFLVLLLCSLLVPGAAIFGFAVTTALTLVILFLSLLQGCLSLGLFPDPAHSRDVKWRIGLDALVVIFLLADLLSQSRPTFQSIFFALLLLLAVDFTISEHGRNNLEMMWSGVRGYLAQCWGVKNQSSV